MRGSALPLLAWSVFIGGLEITLYIWSGREVPVLAYGFGVAVILVLAGGLISRQGREAIKPGEPPSRAGHLITIPDISLGAPLFAVGVAFIAFSFVFGRAPLFIGGGIVVISLVRMFVERRHELRARREMERAFREDAPS